MSTQTISEKVDVIFENYPKVVIWKSRDYKITKLGLHHKYHDGKTLYHIFSVVSDTLFLRLKLDTSNLLWTLEQIADNGL